MQCTKAAEQRQAAGQRGVGQLGRDSGSWPPLPPPTQTFRFPSFSARTHWFPHHHSPPPTHTCYPPTLSTQHYERLRSRGAVGLRRPHRAAGEHGHLSPTSLAATLYPAASGYLNRGHNSPTFKCISPSRATPMAQPSVASLHNHYMMELYGRFQAQPRTSSLFKLWIFSGMSFPPPSCK